MTQPPHEIIATRGFHLTQIALPGVVLGCLRKRDWKGLDQAIRRETLSGGTIFDELLRYARFSEIEFIISIRSSLEEPDEDGIWHDDGSRLLAFSLSLTLDADSIGGGRLELRKPASGSIETLEVLPTPPYGTMIVFATGQLGFEHRIGAVTSGERIIIAGWCT